MQKQNKQIDGKMKKSQSRKLALGSFNILHARGTMIWQVQEKTIKIYLFLKV